MSRAQLQFQKSQWQSEVAEKAMKGVGGNDSFGYTSRDFFSGVCKGKEKEKISWFCGNPTGRTP